MSSQRRMMMIAFIYTFASFSLWGCADGKQVQGTSTRVQRPPVSEEKKAEIIAKSKLRQEEESKKKKNKKDSGDKDNQDANSGNTGTGSSNNQNANASAGNNSSANANNGRPGTSTNANAQAETNASTNNAPGNQGTNNDSEGFVPHFQASAEIKVTEANKTTLTQSVFNEGCRTKGLPIPVSALHPQIKKDSIARYSFQLTNRETKITGSRTEKVTAVSDNEIQMQSELTLFKKKQDGAIKVSMKSDHLNEDSKTRPDKFLNDFQYCYLKGQENPELPDLAAVGEFFVSKDKSLAAYQFERVTLNATLECQAKTSEAANDKSKESKELEANQLAKKVEIRVDQIERFVYAPSALNIGFNQCGGALVLKQKSIRLAKSSIPSSTASADEGKAFYIENEVNYSPILKGEVRTK